MNAIVYYDKNGVIQSVVSVNPEAQTTAVMEFDSIEIEIEDEKENFLFEIHSQYQVDTIQHQLIPRSNISRQKYRAAS